jgi:hypothetical protein
VAQVTKPTIGFSAADQRYFLDLVARAPIALNQLLRVPALFSNFTGVWPTEEYLPWLWRPLTGVQIAGAEFPGGARVVSGDGTVAKGPPGAACALAGIAGSHRVLQHCATLCTVAHHPHSRTKSPPPPPTPHCSATTTTTTPFFAPAGATLGNAPGWTVGDVVVPRRPLGPSGPVPSVSPAALAAATVPGKGPLGLPPLLHTMAPLNEGAGRLYYKWHAAQRARLAAGPTQQ